MIPIDSLVGITATLSIVALIGVIGIAIHVKRLLTRCKDILGFAFFIAERNDERRTLRRLDEEESGND